MLYTLVVRSERRACDCIDPRALRPPVEHPSRRAGTDGRVDERAAAERDGLHRGQIHVAAGRPHPSLSERTVQRFARLLSEVLGAEGWAFLDQDDVAPSFTELLRDNRTSWP